MNAVAMNPSPWVEAKVVRVAHITPRLVSVALQAKFPIPPISGQHVDVRLTAEDGYVAQRSYSIASAPCSDHLELIVERLEDGEVSPFFHDVLQAGDSIDLRGPLGGHFVWRPEDRGPLLLVAGGSGVAPLMAMLRQWGDTVQPEPLLLVYSARTWAELAFLEELEALQRQRSNFEFVAVTTREPARRAGDLDRRLDSVRMAELLTRWRPHVPRHVFVCGSNGFVEAATQGLIDAGVPMGIVRTERYGGAS